MRRRLSFCLGIALSLLSLASGCYNLEARTGRVSDARVREHLQQDGKAIFLFWGLYRASDPSGPLWGRERPAVSSLHVHTYLSFTDALVTTVTFGVIVPWTVETEAEVLE
ncbi:MAG: hypothetical protein HYR85_06120 [Planctomycetes bacterium]|nr:hypothetical protein [Planctomycetota bacterium]MBI3847304.1 hypothetical protein [Planctomycetota bacterium]